LDSKEVKMIKIDFSETHEIYGTYADSLNLEDDHTFTEDEIEAMKKQRFDNWVNHIVEMSNVTIESPQE